MIGSSSFMDDLEILSRILIRCFVIGVVFITFWFIFFLLGGNAGYHDSYHAVSNIKARI